MDKFVWNRKDIGEVSKQMSDIKVNTNLNLVAK